MAFIGVLLEWLQWTKWPTHHRFTTMLELCFASSVRSGVAMAAQTPRSIISFHYIYQGMHKKERKKGNAYGVVRTNLCSPCRRLSGSRGKCLQYSSRELLRHSKMCNLLGHLTIGLKYIHLHPGPCNKSAHLRGVDIIQVISISTCILSKRCAAAVQGKN